jgi:hypothetical protein
MPPENICGRTTFFRERQGVTFEADEGDHFPVEFPHYAKKSKFAHKNKYAVLK